MTPQSWSQWRGRAMENACDDECFICSQALSRPVIKKGGAGVQMSGRRTNVFM